MENTTASPQPGASQSVSSVQNHRKITLNPLVHLKEGVSAFVKTNLNSGIIAMLASSIASIVITVVFMYAIFLFTDSADLFKLLVVLIGAAILAALIMGYFGSAVNRLIITGTRGQRESAGHAFRFVLQRLPKIILTYMLIFAIFVGATIVISLMARISPALGFLAGLAGFIAGIIFALRISYVPLILIDDNDPGGPMEVIRASASLWKKSSGPLFVYGLSWLVVYIVLKLVIGDPGSSSNLSSYEGSSILSPDPVFSVAIGGVLLYSFLSNLFGALVYSGAASIYNQARQLVGGLTSGAPKSPAGPTPVQQATAESSAPVAPQAPGNDTDQSPSL